MHSIMLVLSRISFLNIFPHCSVLGAWPRAGAEYTEERDRLRTATVNVFWALYSGPDSILSAPSGGIFLIAQLAVSFRDGKTC